ncbi:MAG TPA: NAD(P)/FAD-dependent oxidoreductase [Sphingopyxis sp.]|nr:NAD(P)/FAD-dependent oxidoreductase [Sphingopyxis sp.]
MTPIEPEDRVEVLIVGAGFSGLCLGARLVREGRRDFVILEKGGSVGGTWRDNRYPGCACDIPSHLYSLSFGPRPDWSRYYPTQPELFAYLEEVARHFDLGPHLQLNTAFADAEWDANEALWRVRTRDGRLFKAAVLVSAIGALHVPEKPIIAGIETFPGAVFHSAEWPADFDATGRRIAVVGTGASAIQFVPELAKRARSLTLFQRTAPWVLPKFDRPIGALQRAALRHMPGYRRLLRASLYWLHEARLLVFTGGTRLRRLARRHGERAIARAIPDTALRAAVTPAYDLGCKRTLLSNDYYPALAAPNVAVRTGGIARVEHNQVVTASGERVTADTIIFGTGFQVVESLKRLDIRGVEGARLAEAWRDGPAAYLGLSVPAFPNFFLMLGPNTGLGHNSQILMIEAQAEHIVRALRWMRRSGATAIEVSAARAAAFDRDTQRRLRTSVWARGGCQSWYQDLTGRVVALWPRSTFLYILLCRRRKAGEYDIVARAPSQARVIGP